MQNDEYLLFATEDRLLAEDATEIQEEETGQFLSFKSGGLLFGVPTEYVSEIITNNNVTPLPMVPEYVRGILNLRGQVIPIVDLRLLMGGAHQEGNCTIVLKLDGTQLGVTVDAVVQMVTVPLSRILPLPAGGAQKLVTGICTIDDIAGSAMMVLDCPLLMQNNGV